MAIDTVTKAGLHRKYSVERTDGSSEAGGKHHGCAYFVLDLDHDPLALWPLKHYADAAYRAGNEALAEDLWALIRTRAPFEFKTIPEQEAAIEATTEAVTARLVELYGPDESNWPRPPQER